MIDLDMYELLEEEISECKQSYMEMQIKESL